MGLSAVSVYHLLYMRRSLISFGSWRPEHPGRDLRSRQQEDVAASTKEASPAKCLQC